MIPDPTEKRKNEIIEAMGEDMVKLVREMLSLHDKYSSEFDDAPDDEGWQKHLISKRFGVMACIHIVARRFTPDMHIQEFIKIVQEQESDREILTLLRNRDEKPVSLLEGIARQLRDVYRISTHNPTASDFVLESHKMVSNAINELQSEDK